jgi:hypothetical protein
MSSAILDVSSSNIPSQSASQLGDNVFTLLSKPDFIRSVFVWGLTGIGKSSIIDQSVRRLAYGDKEPEELPESNSNGPAMTCTVYGQWGLIDLRISLLDSSDLKGIPSPENNLTRWFPPEELPLEGQEDRFPEFGVLFLDEMNLAEPAVQSASYSLVLDRKVGNHKLLKGWKVVAAGNLMSEEAFTHELGHPLKNRFLHYMLVPDLEAFKAWGYAANIEPDIIAFLSYAPDYLHRDDSQGAYAFPTPRSWQYADEILKIFSNGQRMVNLSACIGQGATTQFLAFQEARNEPELKAMEDIHGLLRGKGKLNLTAERPIVAWSVTGAYVSYIKDNPADIPLLLEHLCSEDWAPARPIARLLLKDLRLVCPKELTKAFSDPSILRMVTAAYKDYIN